MAPSKHTSSIAALVKVGTQKKTLRERVERAARRIRPRKAGPDHVKFERARQAMRVMPRTLKRLQSELAVETDPDTAILLATQCEMLLKDITDGHKYARELAVDWKEGKKVVAYDARKKRLLYGQQAVECIAAEIQKEKEEEEAAAAEKGPSA